MKIQFDIEKKQVYFIVGLAVILLGIFIVTAANPGHTFSQITQPSSCQNNQFLKWTGTAWACETITADSGDLILILTYDRLRNKCYTVYPIGSQKSYSSNIYYGTIPGTSPEYYEIPRAICKEWLKDDNSLIPGYDVRNPNSVIDLLYVVAVGEQKTTCKIKDIGDNWIRLNCI